MMKYLLLKRDEKQKRRSKMEKHTFKLTNFNLEGRKSMQNIRKLFIYFLEFLLNCKIEINIKNEHQRKLTSTNARVLLRKIASFLSLSLT